MLRRNFRARMIACAAIWISVALVASGLLLSGVFRNLVASHFDHDLQDHARELGSLVEINSDGRPFLARDFSDPRYLAARSGHYWQVHLPGGEMIRSPSLDADLELPAGPDGDSPAAANVNGPTGPMRMLQRVVQGHHLNKPIEIRIGADERLISDEMSHLHMVLATSLGLMAFGMIGTAYAQVAFGLRPLARIRDAVSAVRSGTVTHLPDDLPNEVMPLVKELNGMISANLAMVERSRIHAGNLAHALKMPLAILTMEARQLECQGHTETACVLHEQCARMVLIIDYQTARARASAMNNAGTSAALAEIVHTVIDAYGKLNAGHQRSFEVEGPLDHTIACDPNDLTEIIGNLVDNAAKWSRQQVVIASQDLGTSVCMSVEDDGPGIPEEYRERVFEVGARLDEVKPGTGLGLAIARDLVALYDGRLWIEQSRFGGAALKLVISKRMPAPV